MGSVSIYDENASEYDAWFDKHNLWFQSEVAALQKVLPRTGKGIEVGIGSGQFAKVLGVEEGVEPSESMAALARKRGLKVLKGTAEKLPYEDRSLDFVLMVTVDCFLDDMNKAFQEIHRVLKSLGAVIIGMIDKSSPLGTVYQAKKEDNIFYCEATFHTVEELTSALKKVNFHEFNYWQTLLNISDETLEELQPGYGKGGFAVISAVK
jgi:ubiquinone/menaquinone biosynthesis C-methylase UbiE